MKATVALAFAGIVGACASPPVERTPSSTSTADNQPPLASQTGFSGPEAVRYDPDQDVYFVGNFNGSGSALDNNGFISRLSPEGQLENLKFIAGGIGGVTLHAPRGMTIVGDTLWAVDVDAIRGFDRRTGAPLASHDFADANAGFLNDIAAGPDGALYITDTGKNRIYRVTSGSRTVALEHTDLGRPNGITWDQAQSRFLVVPYGGSNAIHSWRPGRQSIDTVATSNGGRFDGVEVLSGGRVLVASQSDSALHLFTGSTGRAIIRTTGAPADIAVDTRRNRVAVPYISLNRVDIWQLPAN